MRPLLSLALAVLLASVLAGVLLLPFVGWR